MKKETNFKVRGKIGLIDADLLDNGTRHPNLVIMKLSRFFKNRGCEVELIESYDDVMENDYQGIKGYDGVYISKVFNFTKIDINLLKIDNVYWGGTGFFEDGGEDLPSEIEHSMPDYHIYDKYIEHDELHKNKEAYWKDYRDCSIGFATRGCFRKCEFCVNKKYDKVNFHSNLSEWVKLERKKIYLWDDNIFAYENWGDVFQELKVTNKSFQFRQGLDIRLLTEEKARVLNDAKYNGDVIFAFDHIKDKELIENKLKIWRQYAPKRGTKLYVLCGFESIDATDIKNTFERIRIITKYGALPYIMRHENYKESKYRPVYVNIARWCNQPQFLKKKSFRQFCEANQYYHKNKETLCLAYSSMLEFEKENPDIAKEYFDMRYDEQDYYKLHHNK